MQLSTTPDKQKFCASLKGKFTFADTAHFKRLLDEVEQHSPSAIELDISELSYVDSAALGMLLLLKDAAKKSNAVVTLKSPQGQVQQLLHLSRFDQLFAISV